MGTRNLVCVVLDGKYRIAQYGQWDGYPTGQGEIVREFLSTADMQNFRARVARVREVSKEERSRRWESNKDGFAKEWPHLSRDAGARILELVCADEDPEVFIDLDFAGDSLFCEWAYVVDLDKNTLEVFKGFNKKPLKSGDRFFGFRKAKDSSEYEPVRLARAWALDDIPEDAMQQLEKDLSEEDE